MVFARLSRVASQNLIQAKSKLPESRTTAALVTPGLRAVDFAPERRSEADCALSGDQPRDRGAVKPNGAEALIARRARRAVPHRIDCAGHVADPVLRSDGLRAAIHRTIRCRLRRRPG